MDIILASNSKRRYDLMKLMGLDFTVIPSNADENVPCGISPADMVMELAKRKALSVHNTHPNTCVVGSDTIVVHEGKIIGKPKSTADAHKTLRMLSGKTHTVYTGIAVVCDDKMTVDYDSTEVTFCELSDKDIDDYIASGDPMDKAGSYGIQGPFCVNIEHINGSYFTVIGLPVHKLHRMLADVNG